MKFVEKMLNNIINSDNHGEAVGLAKGLKEYLENDSSYGKIKVVLTDCGNSRINVIKKIRYIRGIGLKEAKELTDVIPNTVLETYDKKEAAELIKELRKEGCKVKIKNDENLQILYGDK